MEGGSVIMSKVGKRNSILLILVSLLLTCLLSVSVSAASVTRVSKKAVVGETFEVRLKGASGVFQWRNTNANVATIIRTPNANSVRVVARSKGSTTVSVINGNIQYVCNIKVYAPKYGMTRDRTIKKGKSFKIKPSGGFGSIKVKSSKSSIVKIYKRGNTFTAKAKKTGKAKISITYCGKKKSYWVTVVTKSIPKQKIAVAISDSGYVSDMKSILKKYGNVTPEVVDTNCNASNYVGLVIPSAVGNVDPVWYQERNTGLSKNVNHGLDSKQLTLISRFLAAGKPILGIGKGMQLINVACGGSLNQASGSHVNALVKNTTVGGSFLNKALGSTVYVMCNHNQSIKKLGTGLQATMIAADGAIEGIENVTRKLYGVQWNTKNTSASAELVIRDFVRMCLR